MKIRRKSNSCLNCGSRMDGIYNYCPLCGQENTDHNISFGKLMLDFFSNYFALDSKFRQSLVPFFTKPGYLTNKFNAGHRMSYANPIRLYLILSLFFFFTFSKVGKKIIGNNDDSVQVSTSKGAKENFSTSLESVEELKVEDLENLKQTTGKGFMSIMRSLPKRDKKKLIDKLGVEVAAQYHLYPKDTVLYKKKIKLTTSDDNFLGDSKFNWDLFNDELKENDDLSDKQVYDSIYLGNAGRFEQLIARQRVKVERVESEYFMGYALKNLPIMMFALLPLFALILKVLYVRRKVLYIKHLVHALHLHAFAYFIYGIAILVTFYGVDGQDIHANNTLSDWIYLFSFIMVSTYTYVSFIKVYKQHWFKTFIKFNLQGFVYAILLILFFVLEMIVSFLMY